MANASSTFTGDTVPLGEAGTGAAYILPQSTAIQEGMDYIDQAQKQKADDAAAAQKQAQQMAADWQKDRVNIKAGTLWQPEINDKANSVMQEGLALRQSGLDPSQYYNDATKQAKVDNYNQHKQEVMNMAEARDKYAEQAKGVDKQIDESVPGDIDPTSIQQYHDFFNKKLSDIMSNGYQLPNLRKSYDIQKDIDALPTSKVDTTTLPDANGVIQHLILPNEDAHAQTAANFVTNRPQVRAMIENKTGVPFDQIPTETDPAVLKQQLDDHYRSLPNIPSLAAQGITSYGNPNAAVNSNGIPDQTPGQPPMQPTTQPGSAYDNLITQQAQKLATAAQLKQNTISMVKGQLDDKVGRTNDQKLSFAYQQEQDRRERLGMERQKFNKWLGDQQNEAGSFQLGNQNSMVPVIKQYTNQSNGGSAGVEPEKGASLYGVNLPAVDAVVKPSMVTDTRTGKTIKNTNPINVKISQIQMVPVFKGLDKDAFNGSEISARQLKAIISGTNTDGATLNNVTFQPFAYGIQSQHDANNIHTITTPIKFSYDAIKGSNVKKINTTTFDQATEQLKEIQANPKFQGFTPEQKMDFLSKKYNLNLN